MTSGFVADLVRLQAQLEHLRKDVAQASSGAPSFIEDIRVELDGDGVAATIRVRSDELHRRDSAEVGAMVIAADMAAAAQFKHEDGNAEGFHRGRRAGSMRDLTARTVAAFDRLPALTPTQPPAVGVDEPIRMTLTSGRIASCTIDRRWLAQATRSDLTETLNLALTTARTAYGEVRRAADQYTQDLSELLADLKATLRTFAKGV
jgi:hypothetical protein